jgi:hypothetical protein
VVSGEVLTASAEATATTLSVIGFMLAPKLSHRPTARRTNHDEERVDATLPSRA